MLAEDRCLQAVHPLATIWEALEDARSRPSHAGVRGIAGYPVLRLHAGDVEGRVAADRAAVAATLPDRVALGQGAEIEGSLGRAVAYPVRVVRVAFAGLHRRLCCSPEEALPSGPAGGAIVFGPWLGSARYDVL